MSIFTFGTKNNIITNLTPTTGSVTTDLRTGNVFRLNLTGPITLANPTNAVDGRTYIWWIKQDGSTRTITLGSKFKIPSSATNPLSFSAGGNKMDMLAVMYDGTKDFFYITSMIPGYPQS